jgi:alkylhydroperoxidase/carboxymuconolactone decarboxylase family protein YurZ
MKTSAYILIAGILLLAAVVLWMPSTTGKPETSAARAVQPEAQVQDDAGLVTTDSLAPGAGLSAVGDPAAAEDNYSAEADAAAAGELAKRLRDAGLDPAERIAALRELAQMGGRPAVEQMLQAAKDILFADQTSPFAAQIAAEMADLTVPEAVEVMGEVLTDRHIAFGPFESLPVTFQDAVTSSLRKNPDPMLVAKSLATQFDASTGNVVAQSRVEMLEHPETTSRLAERAQAAADEGLLQERLAMLQTTRDGRVYDTVVRMAQDGTVPRGSLDEVMVNWASRRTESVDFERLMAIAADNDGAYEERAFAAIGIAAYAQATPQVRDQVSETLTKPLGDQNLDGRVRQSFQQAIALLSP